MVQTLISVFLAVVAVLALRRRYVRAAIAANYQNRRWWWERRKRDRDDLLEAAHDAVLRGKFRHRRPDESAWSYAKAFDRWVSQQLKTAPTVQWSKPFARAVWSPPLPKRPRRLTVRWSKSAVQAVPLFQLLKAPRNSTTPAPVSSGCAWSSAQYYWWAAEHGGLVHRAVVLMHDHDGSFVLRCDHDVLLEPIHVSQYPDGDGPVLTCVHCFGMART